MSKQEKKWNIYLGGGGGKLDLYIASAVQIFSGVAFSNP